MLSIADETIFFDTSSNRLYSVDYSTHLMNATWQPLIENEPGTGSVMPVVLDAELTNCFYRAKAMRPLLVD